MTATAVSPTSQRPRHDVTLTDGTTTVGFILTDSQGKPNPRAISDSPQQRTAVKTSSGDNKYSDLVPPWGTFVIDDWSGGRGIRWQDDDKSRFYESVGVDTSKSGEAVLGIRHKISATQPWNKYYDTLTDYMAVRYQANTGSVLYVAQSFVAPTGMTTVNQVTIPAQHDYATGSGITMTLHADTANAPGAQLTNGSKSVSTYGPQDKMYLTFNFSPAVSVTAGTTYWVKLSSTENTVQWAWHFTNVPFFPDLYSESADGTNWVTNGSAFLPIRVTGNAIHNPGILLEYKQAIYYITRPTDTFAAKMYLNGDRGAADSNTGALTTLVDATKSWTNGQWANCIVKIIAGPGSEEERPWRYISNNTATTLTVSQAWVTTHTTSTEYVIIETDYWQEIEDFSVSSAPVQCAVATDKFIYVGWGNSNAVIRYEAYNNAGTWTDRVEAESPGGVSVYAQKMSAITRGDNTYLYVAVNNDTTAGDFHRWAIDRYEVPKQWGELIGKRVAQIAPTDEPWDSDNITNVTQTTSAGATKIAIAAALTVDTSNGTTVAIENLAEPIDITQANSVGCYIMSSTAVSANKIRFLMDDTPNLGKTVLPIAMFEASAIGSSATFTDMQDAIDGTGSSYTVTGMTSSEYIYVISDRKFNKVTFDFTATVNNNAATMGFLYFNGSFWVTLPLSSLDTDGTGTSSGGATFAKDGYIAFVPPDDWEKITINDVEGYAIALAPSATLDDVGIFEVTVQRQNLLTCTIAEALVANQWQWIEIAITPTEEPAPNETNIQSIGLQILEDNGAQNIYLRGGILAIGGPFTIDMPNERVNNMIGYSGNQTGIENLWVFTDKSIYELQAENNDEVVELPIKELEQISGSRTGTAACVNDVYMWFNLGKKIERYYLRNLDDIGPDKDEGLMSMYRDGVPTAMISLPGRVLLVVDRKNLTEYHAMFSSVLQHRGGGWHSFYRAPAYSSIGAIITQRIADESYSYVWLQEDSNLLYFRLADEPYQQTTQRFVPQGYIDTGWIHCGMMDVPKTFGDVKLFAEYKQQTDNNARVALHYKADDDTEWTQVIGDSFGTEPSDTVNLGITAKRLKLRLEFTNTVTGLAEGVNVTPRAFALLLEYFAVVPVKYNYGWTSALKEDFMSIDLRGENELVLGYTSRAETAYAQLRTWANAGTKLTQNSRFSVYDNKTVILNAPASQPIQIDSDEQREEILISVSSFDL